MKVDSSKKASTYESIGELYLKMSKKESAKRNFVKALEIRSLTMNDDDIYIDYLTNIIENIEDQKPAKLSSGDKIKKTLSELGEDITSSGGCGSIEVGIMKHAKFYPVYN
mmetsp:Transcript_24668/g.21833  ORF Transcript_24668/g.21833 Transcript_24668/m.21833 type:complete len:110 (-) Transcript_24668:78-407(-)